MQLASICNQWKEDNKCSYRHIHIYIHVGILISVPFWFSFTPYQSIDWLFCLFGSVSELINRSRDYSVFLIQFQSLSHCDTSDYSVFLIQFQSLSGSLLDYPVFLIQFQGLSDEFDYHAHRKNSFMAYQIIWWITLSFWFSFRAYPSLWYNRLPCPP